VNFNVEGFFVFRFLFAVVGLEGMGWMVPKISDPSAPGSDWTPRFPIILIAAGSCSAQGVGLIGLSRTRGGDVISSDSGGWGI